MYEPPFSIVCVTEYPLCSISLAIVLNHFPSLPRSSPRTFSIIMTGGWAKLAMLRMLPIGADLTSLKPASNPALENGWHGDPIRSMWIPSVRHMAAGLVMSALKVCDLRWLCLCVRRAELSLSIEIMRVPPVICAITEPPPIPAQISHMVQASFAVGGLAWLFTGIIVDMPGLSSICRLNS